MRVIGLALTFILAGISDRPSWASPSPIAFDLKTGSRLQILRITGTLGAGTGLTFTDDVVPGLRPDRNLLIVLNSDGGWMLEMTKLIDQLLAHRLRLNLNSNVLWTHVEDFCHSACVPLYALGNQRSASETARFGFHAPAIDGVPEPELARLFVQLLKAAGFNSDWLERRTPTFHQTELLELSPAQLIQERSGLILSPSMVAPILEIVLRAQDASTVPRETELPRAERGER